jgi:hypothetical protein
MKGDGGRCASNITTCKESLMKWTKEIELLKVTRKGGMRRNQIKECSRFFGLMYKKSGDNDKLASTDTS